MIASSRAEAVCARRLGGQSGSCKLCFIGQSRGRKEGGETSEWIGMACSSAVCRALAGRVGRVRGSEREEQ